MPKIIKNPPRRKYASYKSYKIYLRKDFKYRCIYCNIHENSHGGYRSFEIDHIKPKSLKRFEHLTHDYNNLVYSCPECNGIKSAAWPSDDPIKDNCGWLDPCVDDYGDHYGIFYTNRKVTIKAKTPLGQWLIINLALDQFTRIEMLENRLHQVNCFNEIIDEIDMILAHNNHNEMTSYLIKVRDITLSAAQEKEKPLAFLKIKKAKSLVRDNR